MKYGSLFSGIEAASVAWAPLGWQCAWVAEIDPFASAVLAHHYPDVPNLGDVNEIDADAVEPVDLVVFGSPCQSFSVAGKRLGLDDPRGNMALVGLRVVSRIRPRWVVWENVPGVLLSDGGRDFGAFLGLLGELGYGFAYRVLDAQHFGVPQRRRRVFVVGCLGDWRPAAAVLFEPESLRGDSPPRRQAGQGVAPCLEAGANRTGGDRPPGTTVDTADSLIAAPLASCAEGGSGYRCDADTADNLIAADVAPPCTSNPYGDHESREGLLVAIDARNGTLSDEAMPVQAGGDCKRGYSLNTIPLAFQERGRKGGRSIESQADLAYSLTAPNGGGRRQEMNIAHSLRADGFDAGEDGTGRGTPLVAWGIIGGAQKGKNHAYRQHVSGCLQHKGLAATGNEAGTLLQQAMSVRRLTPRECERLQGLPDDYTLIPYRGKPATDGPRYRAIGNSMAVPVVRWLGHRIQLFEETAASLAKGSAAA